MTILTDQYVHAATRFVQDAKEREELALELRERIEDTIAALVENGHEAEDAERKALTGLGDPLLLSAEYRERPTYLIGPRFFYVYLRILLVAVCTGAPIVGIITALVRVSEGGDVGDVIGSGIAEAFSIAIHITFWVTLVFAALDRLPAKAGQPEWNLDLLPQLPGPCSTQRRTDMIASIVALLITVVALVWQHVGSPFIGPDGRIPMISPELWNPWLLIVLALLALEAIHAIWLYRSGWTWPLAAVNTVIALAFAAVVVPLLLQHRVLNPELIEYLGWTGGTESGDVIAAVVIIAITVWEIGNGLVKTARRAKA